MCQMLSKEIAFLEKMHEVLNAQYFEGKLSKPVITIQSSPKFFGHCSRAKVWKDGQGTYYEINIAAEYMARPLVEVAATMQHEMVHQYCSENKIQDCSRSGNYHNGKFKAEAEARGLIIEKIPGAGWSKTTPTPEFAEFVAKRWKREIELHRNTPPKEKKKKESSTRKYICPECGLIVRATKEAKIMCYECEEIMQLDED